MSPEFSTTVLKMCCKGTIKSRSDSRQGVPETSGDLYILTRLSAREVFTECFRRENFKTHTVKALFCVMCAYHSFIYNLITDVVKNSFCKSRTVEQ